MIMLRFFHWNCKKETSMLFHMWTARNEQYAQTSQGAPGPLGSYMVAFAGRKHAARSFPVMISDNNTIITSFTLVNSLNILVAFPLCYFLRCNSNIDIRKVLCLRSLNSRRVPFKPCIGRNLDANHAPRTLFASVVKTVHYQSQSVRVTVVLMIVIWAYN